MRQSNLDGKTCIRLPWNYKPYNTILTGAKIEDLNRDEMECLYRGVVEMDRMRFRIAGSKDNIVMFVFDILSAEVVFTSIFYSHSSMNGPSCGALDLNVSRF